MPGRPPPPSHPVVTHLLLTFPALIFWGGALSLIAYGFTISSAPASLLAAAPSCPFVLRQRLLLVLTGSTVVVAAVSATLLALFPKNRVVQIVHAAALLLSLAALLSTCAIFFLGFSGRNSVFTRDGLQAAWISAVSSGKVDLICDAERKYGCRGFQDFDCIGCALGTEAACSKAAGNAGNRCVDCGSPPALPERGCWAEFSDAIGRVYLTGALISTFVLVVCAVHACVVLFSGNAGRKRLRFCYNWQNKGVQKLWRKDNVEARPKAKKQRASKRPQAPREKLPREQRAARLSPKPPHLSDEAHVRLAYAGNRSPRRPPPAAKPGKSSKKVGGRLEPNIKAILKQPPKKNPFIL